MFQFVTEGFETYMKRKLLSVAHNRYDNFISHKYKGLLAEKIDKSSIKVLDSFKKMFLVNSSKDSKISYRVDMEIGTCSCETGQNGSPCSHQAAIVLHYHVESVNLVPTLHPTLRQKVAFLALGNQASKTTAFYSALHEGIKPMTVTENVGNTSDFSGTSWDVIRAGTLDDISENNSEKIILDQSEKAELIGKIDDLAQSLKNHLDSNDPQLIPGIKKFIDRFNAMKSTGQLASAMHTFGTQTRAGVSLASENRRWGKRIGVQATASGRRKHGSKGKGQVIAGRPRNSYVNKVEAYEKHSRYNIPTRKKNQINRKRQHNLSENIKIGKQNGGKW